MQPNKIQPDKVQASIDISISIIRGIAFCSIVCCHIFQYLNIELAWWFNVGVQVFLCISGYLYGSKEPSPPIYFYKRRFKKILRPYYIVIIPVCVLYTLYAPDKINCLKIIHVLLVHGTLEGGGHLWFIATILMCYIITPLLFDLFNRDFSKFSFFMQCLAVNSVCLIFFGLYAPYFNAANIICYVIGFCLGFNEKKQIIKHSSIFLLISALTILNFPQIFIDYVLNLNFQGRIQFIYNVFCAFNHVWLGIFLFLLLKDHIIPRLLLKHTITYKLL